MILPPCLFHLTSCKKQISTKHLLKVSDISSYFPGIDPTFHVEKHIPNFTSECFSIILAPAFCYYKDWHEKPDKKLEQGRLSSFNIQSCYSPQSFLTLLALDCRNEYIPITILIFITRLLYLPTPTISPIDQLATMTPTPFSALQLPLQRNLKPIPIVLALCPFHLTFCKPQISTKHLLKISGILFTPPTFLT